MFQLPDETAAAVPQHNRRERGRVRHFTASFHLDVVSEAKVGPVVGPCSIGACPDGGEWIMCPLAAPTIGPGAGRPQVVWRPASLAPRLEGGICASSGGRRNGRRRNGGATQREATPQNRWQTRSWQPIAQCTSQHLVAPRLQIPRWLPPPSAGMSAATKVLRPTPQHASTSHPPFLLPPREPPTLASRDGPTQRSK